MPSRTNTGAGELRSARWEAGGIELAYVSGSRALAVLDRTPGRVEIDGAEAWMVMVGLRTLSLPQGQHLVTIR